MRRNPHDVTPGDMVALAQPFDAADDRRAEAREMSELAMNYYTGEGMRADGAPTPPPVKRRRR